MNLKTRINILTSRSEEGVYNLIWKDESDLSKQIEIIVDSFSQSTESVTPINTIVWCIQNNFKDRIKIYDGMAIDLESFAKIKLDLEVSTFVKNLIKDEDSKKGNFALSLSEEEMYNLFSLSKFRESKLNQII